MKRVSLAVLAAALLVAPSVGEAAKAKRSSACPDNALCLWEGKNYRGDREVFRGRGTENVSRTLNNKASSLKIRSNNFGYVYEGRDGNGIYLCLLEANEPDLSEEWFNNVISSIQLRSPDRIQPPC